MDERISKALKQWSSISTLPFGKSTKEKRCQALDYGSYLDRVNSYKSRGWFAKPMWLWPMETARYGWQKVDGDMLQCVTCNAFISAALPRNFAPSVYEACCKRIKASLCEGHSNLCPWKTNHCPGSFMEIVLGTYDEEMEKFKDNAQELIKFDKKLPFISMEVLPKELQSVPKDILHGMFKDEEIVGSAVLMALSGWQAKNNAISATAECKFCNRQIGLWNFYNLEDKEQGLPKEICSLKTPQLDGCIKDTITDMKCSQEMEADKDKIVKSTDQESCNVSHLSSSPINSQECNLTSKEHKIVSPIAANSDITKSEADDTSLEQCKLDGCEVDRMSCKSSDEQLEVENSKGFSLEFDANNFEQPSIIEFKSIKGEDEGLNIKDTSNGPDEIRIEENSFAKRGVSQSEGDNNSKEEHSITTSDSEKNYEIVDSGDSDVESDSKNKSEASVYDLDSDESSEENITGGLERKKESSNDDDDQDDEEEDIDGDSKDEDDDTIDDDDDDDDQNDEDDVDEDDDTIDDDDQSDEDNVDDDNNNDEDDENDGEDDVGDDEDDDENDDNEDDNNEDDFDGANDDDVIQLDGPIEDGNEEKKQSQGNENERKELLTGAIDVPQFSIIDKSEAICSSGDTENVDLKHEDLAVKDVINTDVHRQETIMDTGITNIGSLNYKDTEMSRVIYSQAGESVQSDTLGASSMEKGGGSTLSGDLATVSSSDHPIKDETTLPKNIIEATEGSPLNDEHCCDLEQGHNVKKVESHDVDLMSIDSPMHLSESSNSPGQNTHSTCETDGAALNDEHCISNEHGHNLKEVESRNVDQKSIDSTLHIKESSNSPGQNTNGACESDGSTSGSQNEVKIIDNIDQPKQDLKRKAVDNEHKPESKRKKLQIEKIVFDPLKEHWSWCPWVNNWKQNQGKIKPTDSADKREGWRLLLHLLCPTNKIHTTFKEVPHHISLRHLRHLLKVHPYISPEPPS